MSAIVWLDERDILILHERLLALDGGPEGVREPGLLMSATARPRQREPYGGADVIAMAAAYTTGIIRNHPFADGNKRTGFVAGIIFLELNGYRFTATEEDAASAVMALADGTLDVDTFTAWLRRNAVLPNS